VTKRRGGRLVWGGLSANDYSECYYFGEKTGDLGALWNPEMIWGPDPPVDPAPPPGTPLTQNKYNLCRHPILKEDQ